MKKTNTLIEAEEAARSTKVEAEEVARSTKVEAEEAARSTKVEAEEAARSTKVEAEEAKKSTKITPILRASYPNKKQYTIAMRVQRLAENNADKYLEMTSVLALSKVETDLVFANKLENAGRNTEADIVRNNAQTLREDVIQGIRCGDSEFVAQRFQEYVLNHASMYKPMNHIDFTVYNNK